MGGYRPAMADPRFSPATAFPGPEGGVRRRLVLRLGAGVALGGAFGGLGLLAGCSRQVPQLLSSRGELPLRWGAALPKPWSLRSLDSPAEVVAAGRRQGGGVSLLQLSDGWATELDRASLQPIGTPALLNRLAPMARPVSRLYAPEGSPVLAFPWAWSPWVLVLRNRYDLLERAEEGWDLLLDPSLRGRVVLPSSPRLVIELIDHDPQRLRRLRAQALAYDERDGLNLLLAGEAEAAVLPRQRVIPLLRRDSRLRALLPEQGAPIGWNLLLRPAAAAAEPPLDWLAEPLQAPLLDNLLAAGWVPPLPPEQLEPAVRRLPDALGALLLPPAAVVARCRSLPPLSSAERDALQQLWDQAAPEAAAAAGA